MPAQGPEFNIVLIGDAGVGKSSFVHRELTGEFSKLEYTPTMQVHTEHIDFTLSWPYHKAFLFVLEIPGDQNLSLSSREALRKADAAIIMFDVTNQSTLDHVSWWEWEVLTATYQALPIVVCGNKMDLVDAGRYIKPESAKHECCFVHSLSFDSFKLKCESRNIIGTSVDCPWRKLLRKLLKDPDVKFQWDDCDFTGHHQMSFMTWSEEELLRYREEMELAMSQPLPDASEDEDDDL